YALSALSLHDALPICFSRGTPPRSQSACKVHALRLLVALLFAFPAGAAPLRAGTPQLQLRLEGLFGQPTTQLGARGGLGVGVGRSEEHTSELQSRFDL